MLSHLPQVYGVPEGPLQVVTISPAFVSGDLLVISLLIESHRIPLGSQVGLISRISEILTKADPSVKDEINLKLVAQSARVVANTVADTDKNRIIYLKQGTVVPDIVRILLEFDDPIIIRNCCGAIANLACNNCMFTSTQL